LPPKQSGPGALLVLWRGHWLIEKRLHWRRDVILREDDSQIRTGAIPQAMAALRDAMVRLVHTELGFLAAAREGSLATRIERDAWGTRLSAALNALAADRTAILGACIII